MHNKALTAAVAACAAALLCGQSAQAGGHFSGKIDRKEIATVCDTVAAWQITHHAECRHNNYSWTNGALFRGMFEWGETAGNGRCLDFLTKVGKSTRWSPGSRVYHADDICVGQAYIKMYEKYSDSRMLQPVMERAFYIASHPSAAPLRKSDPVGKNERWSWCDALFMAPPVFASLYRITGEQVYADYLQSEFREAADSLYDRQDHLYYRDNTRIPKRERNGAKQFWSRGNGWVFAGIPLILDELPQDDPTRGYYEEMFREMAFAVLALQDKDGHWHASMMDPESYPDPENSGSAFFCYGFAWGIRHGLLDRRTYWKPLKKGWEALVEGVHEDGMLGHVQPVGAGPNKSGYDQTEVYGVGAMLLAGSELYKLAKD